MVTLQDCVGCQYEKIMEESGYMCVWCPKIRSKTMSEEIVYFELNNWFYGRDYPGDKQFSDWVNSHQFSENEWCKENKLCVLCGNYDMSVNWCITAPKLWVEENCPKLLSDEKYTYTVCSYYKGVHKSQEKEGAYSNFLRPDGYGRFNWKFLEYEPANYGVTWCDEEGVINRECLA